MIERELSKKIHRVLKQLMSEAEAEIYFNIPVDPDLLGIPQYRDIIKEPMDLGTIIMNLESREYESYQDLLRDVALVWKNCQYFNRPDSDVYKASEKLSRLFIELWTQEKLPGLKNVMMLGSTASSSMGSTTRIKKKGRKRIVNAEQDQLQQCQNEIGNTSDTGSNSHTPNNQKLVMMEPCPSVSNNYINVCLKIIKKLINTRESKLCQKLQKSENKSLEKIKEILESKYKNNSVYINYDSSLDVLRDIAGFLKMIVLDYDGKEDIKNTCNKLFFMATEEWKQAGLENDLHQLKQLSKSKQSKEEAKNDKLEDIASELKNARDDLNSNVNELETMRQVSVKEMSMLDNRKERLAKEAIEIKKELIQLESDRDSAIKAIKEAEKALEELEEAKAVLKEVERLESESMINHNKDVKLNVHPKDDIVMDEETWKRRKLDEDKIPDDILELGKYWCKFPLSLKH